jgi:hypothetical protein
VIVIANNCDPPPRLAQRFAVFQKSGLAVLRRFLLPIMQSSWRPGAATSFAAVSWRDVFGYDRG